MLWYSKVGFIVLVTVLLINWVWGIFGFRKIFMITGVNVNLAFIPVVREVVLADLWIDGPEYWAAGFYFPSWVIRFGGIVAVLIGCIPKIGGILWIFASAIFCGPLYINVFADLDDDSDFAMFLTGVLCAVIPFWGYLKMMSYDEEDFIE